MVASVLTWGMLGSVLLRIFQLLSRVSQVVPLGVDGAPDIVRAGGFRRVIHETIQKLDGLGNGRFLNVLGMLCFTWP